MRFQATEQMCPETAARLCSVVVALSICNRKAGRSLKRGQSTQHLRNDDRYGGYTRPTWGQPENSVVVLYKPNNRAHRSLLFHQIQVHSVVPLRLPERSTDEQVPS